MIGGHFTRVTSHTYTLACILRWKKLKSKVFPLLFSFSTICENEFVWLWSLYCSSLEIWAVMVLIGCFFISTIKQKLHFSLACSGIRIYTGRFKKLRASESEYVWKWVLTVLECSRKSPDLCGELSIQSDWLWEHLPVRMR